MGGLPDLGLKKASSNALVTRILQIAVGLFVTTTDLPRFETKNYLNVPTYDCSFDDICRWAPGGYGTDRWRLATSDPDSFLWFAATGTTMKPHSPYALIELRGKEAEWLMTDAVECQKGSAMLSFTYWTIGDADLEICLTDDVGHKYNCTGMLQARTMPGKVSLKIPELQRSYHVSICPNSGTGVIAIDNIKYDALPCVPEQLLITNPVSLTTETPSVEKVKPPTAVTKPLTGTRQRPEGITTRTVVDPETAIVVETTTDRFEKVPTTTPEMPFDVLILGNKTSPFRDRRKGRFLSDTSQLLCDFSPDFPCRWGPESGRWGIIQEGAIPSMAAISKVLPSYPAAVVIQGSAMLSSDPLRCQTGAGKVLFRYWSNAKIFLQLCALGYGTKSMKIECVERSHKKQTFEDRTLAVFDLPNPIDEPFTLNIVPQWGRLSHNEYLVIDEIAYIGECDLDKLEEKTRLIEETSTAATRNQTTVHIVESTAPRAKTNPFWTTKQITITTQSVLATATTTPSTTTESTTTTMLRTSTRTTTIPIETMSTAGVETIAAITTSVVPPTAVPLPTEASPSPAPATIPTYRPSPQIVTPMPFVEIVQPIIEEVTAQPPDSFTVGYTPFVPPVTESYIFAKDYCALLNCNFELNACHYLNHGFTKAPWSLRNRGYGFPLSRYSDIRQAPGNGQFVSAMLSPGDFAILESPKFNMTRGLNVLLFQYYRPSFYSTIRLCIGTRYSNPFRTIQSFLQCPPVLRSTSSRNAHRWNTAHAQIPVGTTHFYLVAHNVPTAREKTAVGIDNIRVAICDPRHDRVTDYGDFYEGPDSSLS